MRRQHHTAIIHRTGRYTFAIASGTRPGVVHTQDVLNLKCSCEAGARGIRCWHLARALMIEQGYRPLRKRTARPTPLQSTAVARPDGRPSVSSQE